MPAEGRGLSSRAAHDGGRDVGTQVWRDDVLAVAWQAVRRNDGAAGVDGETVADVESFGVDRWLEALARDLKAGTYRPQPVRSFRQFLALGNTPPVLVRQPRASRVVHRPPAANNHMGNSAYMDTPERITFGAVQPRSGCVSLLKQVWVGNGRSSMPPQPKSPRVCGLHCAT